MRRVDTRRLIGVGEDFASPPSEPCVRFSRTRLSSRQFPHRECLARQTAFRVSSSWSAKRDSVPTWMDRARLDTVTSADTMRLRMTDASAPWSLCLLDSPEGTTNARACIRPSLTHLPSCPAFPRPGFATRASRGLRHSGTMRALTPEGFTRACRSLRLLRFAFGASNPQPRDAPGSRFVSHSQRLRSILLRASGFAL